MVEPLRQEVAATAASDEVLYQEGATIDMARFGADRRADVAALFEQPLTLTDHLPCSTGYCNPAYKDLWDL